MRAMWGKFVAKVKSYFHELMQPHVSPHSIAFGFALGTVISILPTIGFSIIIALFLIFIFKKINKVAMIVALLVWNPVTLVPMYMLSFYVGQLLFDVSPTAPIEFTFWNHVYYFTRRFLVGNFIVAVGTGLISYALLYKIVYIFRWLHRNNRVENDIIS